ncbi:MAG TPA: protease complex subunit PrcB family protein [Longimicrobium sp.]|nr:protease complex subunit PrcB family protein [Longimicrobium sp.]
MPDTAVYAQIDTAGVQVPPELSAFCHPGTTSLRPAGLPPADAPGSTVPASDVYREKVVYLGRPVRCVVRRAEEWAALWSAMVRPVSPVPPLPAVDFRSRMVLVAAMGTQPTTGYGIGIVGVRRTGAGIAATVLRYTPSGCEVGMAETEPAHAVSVPRTDAPVRFIEKVRYGSDC